MGEIDMKRFPMILAIISLFIIGGLAACSQDGAIEEKDGKKQITIGYFPNLTHIATMVALENDYFDEAFGEEVEYQTKIVTNGGLFMEAMATSDIDVGTVGPGPLLNFYVKDPKYHLISGAVNGGAVLAVSEESGIEDLADLDGKKVAIPVIGSTQDVMLRKALEDVDRSEESNGGSVELFAADPADTTTLFAQKSVDAAATQEPWGYVLETQADGELLLDWESFAWGKDSTNTVVAATETFSNDEELAASYLTAHEKAVQFVKENPQESQELEIGRASCRERG